MAHRFLAALGLLLLPLAAWAETLRPLPAVLHVHSTFSTGDLPLDRLVMEAQARGLEAVLLSENYLLRVEYGLWPFRAATRVVHEEPSVLSRGVEAYLAQVSEVRRRFPEMLIVPGVEVIPHYHWTGSPLTGDLTHHDLQKNLLVFGITDPADLKRLPSTGNPYLARRTVGSLVEALPGLLVLPGLWLILVKRRRLLRVGGFTVVERRRRWLPGAPLVVLGVVALVRAFPFTEDPLSPYRPDSDLATYQALIDQVDARGGVSVWSFPEARDASESSFLGFLRVRMRTDPYPDDLVRTFRYTAFGAVYEDTTRFATPGGTWDYLLGKYLSGERTRPPWAVGESGFHGFLGGKRFGGIQTVFLVGDRSEAAILSSFRAGQMYALSRTPAYALALQSWSVRQGDAEARSGETLQAGAAPLEIRVGVDASDGGEYPLRAFLVKNGQIIQLWMGKTPLRVAHREPAGVAPAYYRLEVRGPAPHQILTNPIFVKPRSAP